MRRHGDRSLWLVLGLLALYSVLHFGFRLLASSSLGEDDSIENIAVQDVGAILNGHQLPLYTSVLYFVQLVMGPGVESFLAIKYAALIATGGFLYATARRFLGPTTLALMTVESLALIYQVSWRYHEGFTHQVGAMVAVSATLWALVRVIEDGRTRDFTVLGIAAGLATLTVPMVLVFLAALAAAAAAEPAVRTRLARPALLMALVLAAIPMAGLAIASGQVAGHDALSPKLSPSLAHSAAGLVNALRGPLFYLSPLILFLPLLFPGFLQRAGRDIATLVRPAAPGDPAAPGLVERIVLRCGALGLVLSAVLGAVLGWRGYASHIFMPLYIVTTVWLMGVVARSAPTPRSLTRFGQLALLIAVVAFVARMANMFVLDPVCKLCRWGIPYPGLAAEIESQALPDAMIVAVDHELAGNIRAQLPARRVMLARDDRLWPEAVARQAGPRLLIWASNAPPDAVRAALRMLGGREGDLARAGQVRVPWRHSWRPVGYRATEWRFLAVGPDGGTLNRGR